VDRTSQFKRIAPFVLFGLALFALIGLALILVHCNSTPAEPVTFRNPLNQSHGSDPWMVYYEGRYYLAATTWSPSSRPGLTMKSATTIRGLIEASPVSVYTDTDTSRCCNFWAPEFHLLDGPNGRRWYFYYSGGPWKCCDGQRMHVLESASTDPMGPYTYKARLHDSIDGWAIDHSVLQLNGSLYLLFSAWAGNYQNIYIAPMSNPWTVSGKRVLISSPTYDWEREDGNVNEGPVALQHDGRTFIIYSASACWGPHYKLGMLIYNGGDPLSPNAWSKFPEPVFQAANGVYGPGHNGFFKSPDGTEDWIVYHANDSRLGGCDVKRTTRIQKFTWNSDGTPNFGSPLPLDTDIPVPSGESR
jgi:GH43 family beta-xylosidase